MENRIHQVIPKQDIAAINDAIKVLEEKLSPHLKTLTTDDRRKLPKMGSSNQPFVRKTLEYTKSDSQFLPVYVEQEQLEVDVNSVEVMNSFYRPLSQIISGLNDSLLLAGSEALQAALGYYQSVKQAAKMNIPDAKVIYEDLSQRFDGRGKKVAQPAEEV